MDNRTEGSSAAPVQETGDQAPVVMVARVRFQPAGKAYSFDATGMDDLQVGDYVLVETSRGRQLGRVVCLRPMREGEHRRDLSPIERRATGHDLALRQHWQAQEADVLALARQAAVGLRLNVKLVSAEYSLDGERLTFAYASDDKIPGLERLQQRVEREVPARVELRRVGARDHAKLDGGYGACGEPRCCACFLSEFDPVSIKMAKTQGVSLSPTEITGMCGRLRCCLNYENEAYEEASAALPRRKKRVMTPQGEGRVVDLLPLKGYVVVQVEDQRLELPADQVKVLSETPSRPEPDPNVDSA